MATLFALKADGAGECVRFPGGNFWKGWLQMRARAELAAVWGQCVNLCV